MTDKGKKNLSGPFSFCTSQTRKVLVTTQGQLAAKWGSLCVAAIGARVQVQTAQ